MDASVKETGTLPEIKYRRVLLKISGEALMGQEAYGIDSAVVSRIADEIVSVHELGVRIALVVGGGNIFRGASGGAAGIDRTTADYMGMLATVINALSFQSALENRGVTTRVLSAIPMATVCEPYIRRRAVRHMEKERIVIFAAGTGNPFFSTDTTAALRASEMGCEVILKATKVDGVYSADPEKEPDAVRYDRLSYFDVLSRNLKFMDTTAISLARENNISIVIFSITAPGTFTDVMRGRGVHTVISEEE